MLVFLIGLAIGVIGYLAYYFIKKHIKDKKAKEEIIIDNDED